MYIHECIIKSDLHLNCLTDIDKYSINSLAHGLLLLPEYRITLQYVYNGLVWFEGRFETGFYWLMLLCLYSGTNDAPCP